MQVIHDPPLEQLTQNDIGIDQPDHYPSPHQDGQEPYPSWAIDFSRGFEVGLEQENFGTGSGSEIESGGGGLGVTGGGGGTGSDLPRLQEPKPIHHDSLGLGILDLGHEGGVGQTSPPTHTQSQPVFSSSPATSIVSRGHTFAIPRLPAFVSSASIPQTGTSLPDGWDIGFQDGTIHHHNRNVSAQSAVSEASNTSATDSGFSSTVNTPEDADNLGSNTATFGTIAQGHTIQTSAGSSASFGFDFAHPNPDFAVFQSQGQQEVKAHGNGSDGLEPGGVQGGLIPGINSFGPTPSPTPYVQAQLRQLFPGHQDHQVQGVPPGQQVYAGSVPHQYTLPAYAVASGGWTGVPDQTQSQLSGSAFGSLGQIQAPSERSHATSAGGKYSGLRRLSTDTSSHGGFMPGVGSVHRQQYRSGSISSTHSDVSGGTEELADWNSVVEGESASSAYGDTFANNAMAGGYPDQIVGGLTELNMRSRSSSIASNAERKAKPYSRHPQSIHQKRSSASLSYVSSPGSSRKPPPTKTHSTRSSVSSAQNVTTRSAWGQQQDTANDEEEEDDEMNGEGSSPISPSNLQPSEEAKAIQPMPCGQERDIVVNTHLQALAGSMGHSKTNVQRDRGRIDWTNDWLLLSYDRWERSSVSRQAMHEAYVAACADFNVKPLNTSTFGKYVREAFQGLQVRRLGNRGNSRYHYCGLRPISVRQANLLNEYSAKHGASNGIYYTLPAHGQLLAQASSALTLDPSEMLMSSSDVMPKHETVKRKIKKNSLSLPSLKPSGIMTCGLDVKTPTASGRVTGALKQNPMSRRSTPGSVSSLSGSASNAGSSMSSSFHSTQSIQSLSAEEQQGAESCIPDFPHPTYADFYVFSDMDRPAAWQLWQSVLHNLDKLSKDVKDFCLEAFEKEYQEFWASLTPQQITICSHSQMSHLLCRADIAVYRDILEFLRSNVVRDLPDAMVNAIATLGENIERIVCESLPATCDEALFDKKIESAARFGHLAVRFRGLHKLSTKLQEAMSSPQVLLAMIGGWSGVPWPRIFDQSALVLDIMPDSLQGRVFGGIAQLLSSCQGHAAQAGPENSGPDNMHSLVTYLKQTIEEFLTLGDGRAHPKPKSILSGFMWLTSEIVRELSLNSDNRVTEFQIMKAFADDYVTLLILSKSTLEPPALQFFNPVPTPDSAISAAQSYHQVSAMMPHPPGYLVPSGGYSAGPMSGAGMSSYGIGSATQAQAQSAGPGKLMILPGMTWVNGRSRTSTSESPMSGLDLPPVPIVSSGNDGSPPGQASTTMWTSHLSGGQAGSTGMGMALTPHAMQFNVGPGPGPGSGSVSMAMQHHQRPHVLLGAPPAGLHQVQLQQLGPGSAYSGVGSDQSGMNLVYPSRPLPAPGTFAYAPPTGDAQDMQTGISGGTNSAVEQMIFTPLASSFGMRSVSAGGYGQGHAQSSQHGGGNGSPGGGGGRPSTGNGSA